MYGKCARCGMFLLSGREVCGPCLMPPWWREQQQQEKKRDKTETVTIEDGELWLSGYWERAE